jgi:RNA polymerase sigma-70 factor (ECF subfamily)
MESMAFEEGIRRVAGAAGGDADTNLVREAQAGAPEAYSELVRRYQDRIYTIVAGMVADREDALDLTQETFVKAYMALDRFRQEAGFYTWLYRIAVHLCIDYSRKRKRYQEPLPLDQYLLHDPSLEPEDTSPSRNPERAAINVQLRAAIRSSLQRLSEPFRTAVILHDIEGLSQEEVARIMDCPRGTAKSRIQRGRYQLRTLLRPYVQPEA